MSALRKADENGVQKVTSGDRDGGAEVGTIQPVEGGFRVRRDGFDETHEHKSHAIKALVTHYRASQ